jgi:hemolysin III
LRQVDRAMIFVMIAGTYTPFTLRAFSGHDGLLPCLPIWSMAAIGVAVTLAFPRRFKRLLIALYLIMGWTVLTMGRSFVAHLSISVLYLLLAGGAAVVWHVLVLLGASLHWVAVAQADIRF